MYASPKQQTQQKRVASACFYVCIFGLLQSLHVFRVYFKSRKEYLTNAQQMSAQLGVMEEQAAAHQRFKNI
jgi:low temperature requirement protein LtrA